MDPLSYGDEFFEAGSSDPAVDARRRPDCDRLVRRSPIPDLLINSSIEQIHTSKCILKRSKFENFIPN